MALEELSINKLPERTQLLLFALIIVLFYFSVSSQLVDPLRNELNGLRREIEGLEGELYRGRNAAAKLPELDKEIRQREVKLQNLRKILPEQKETAQIIRNIQGLAIDSKLKIKRFIPQETTENDFYQDWPIEISMEGTYNNLGVFFESVGQFTRIINVDEITIKRLEKSSRGRTIEATCTATTFVFLEEATTS